MDDNFASLFRSVTSDHSVPDDSWYLGQDYDDPGTVSNYHTSPLQSGLVPNYSSDSESRGYGTRDLANESLKENHSSKSPRGCAESNDNDPFSLHCRIPVPDVLPMSRYHMWLETSFMCKRNERERQRVRNVNDGFSRLRNHLPRTPNMRRRQSKVETLQHAIQYIQQLQDLLGKKVESDGNNQ